MTQVHISTVNVNVITDDMSEEQAGGMFVSWRLAAERGPDTPVSFAAMDEQGHRITLCVRSGDIRSMHWVNDDDPLLLKERMLAALGVDRDAQEEAPEGSEDDEDEDEDEDDRAGFPMETYPVPEDDGEAVVSPLEPFEPVPDCAEVTGEMDIDAYDGSGD